MRDQFHSATLSTL